MIDQIGERLISEVPLPVRIQHAIDRHRGISKRRQVQQIPQSEACLRVVKVPQAMPHAHEVVIQSPWMLPREHHELNHFPATTPEALRHAFMNPSTSTLS